MTRFERNLIAIILGIPGFLLWVGGFGACVFAVIGTALGSRMSWPDGLLLGAAALGVSMIGFLMVATVEIMTGSSRYWMPRRHLPAFIGFEFLTLASGALLGSAVLATLVSWIFGTFSPRWFLFDLAALASLLAVLHFKKRCAKDWLSRARSEEPIPGDS